MLYQKIGLLTIFVSGMLSATAVRAQANGEGLPASPAAVEICKNSEDTKSENSHLDARRFGQSIAVYNCWLADTANARQYYLNGLYSRWILEEVPANVTLARDYDSERRPPLVRMLWGKSRGAVMSVKIKMRDPDVEFTVPLMSLDYSGKSGEGETFATAFTSSEMGMPDFRLSSNTSVSIEATARVTKDVDVQSTGIVLGALRDSLSFVAPAGSLLTSVNREQVQRLSSAYDSALSKLLSSTITETSTVGRLLSEWYPTSSILISVNVPKDIRTIGSSPDDAGTGLRRIWFRLTMACPRVSIFDVTNVCATGVPGGVNMRTLINSPYNGQTAKDAAHAVGQPGTSSVAYQQLAQDLRERVTSNQVLNFRVGPGRTIRQYLTEQEWFIALSKQMVQPDADVTNKIAAMPLPDLFVAERTGTLVDPAPLTSTAKRVAKTASDANVKVAKALSSAAQFCDAVIEKLFSSGLSLLDARLGLWAVASGMPDFAGSRQVFAQSPGCRANLPDQGRGSWSFDPTAL